MLGTKRSRLITAAVATAVLAAGTPALARPGRDPASVARGAITIERGGGSSIPGRHAPRQVLVRFHSVVPEEHRRAAAAAADARVVRRLPLAGLEVVQATNGATTRSVIAALASDPAVRYAEPNYVYRATRLPNDPGFVEQWGLHNTGQTAGTSDADLDAPEAWDFTVGNPSVLVGVVDSGVVFDHPDLAGNAWHNEEEMGAGRETNGVDDDGNGLVDDWQGWDWVDHDNVPLDALGHGTHVAGTIGAVGGNGLGTVGVNWDVGVMPLRALDAQGEGTGADVIAAFTYAAREGARVVNASLGGPSYSRALEDAIAAAPNTLFIVAAGNGGADGLGDDVEGTPDYPCSFDAPNVVCVAATDADDRLAPYSNYGSTSVDLAAPGSGIVSTFPSFLSPFSESFDADLGGRWNVGGVGVTWGREQVHDDWHLSDSPGSRYRPNSDTWAATANPIDLSGGRECAVNYNVILDNPGDDVLAVEGSSDARTWSRLAGWLGSTGGSPVGVRTRLGAFSGSPTFFLRFRLLSDGTLEGDGAHIDDVSIRCLAASGGAYASFSGTSMASPHVAGAAALLWAAVPGLSAKTVKEALLGGVDVSAGLTGTTVSGGRLNLRRSIELVAPGVTPSPWPSPAATANASPSPSPEPTSPSPEPSGSVTPSPVASSPGPQATPAPARTVHDRAISLALRRHLVAKGAIRVADGYAPCIRGIRVTLRRNGRVVRRTLSESDGTYRFRLRRDRTGRYTAHIASDELGPAEEHICEAAESRSRRHFH